MLMWVSQALRFYYIRLDLKKKGFEGYKQDWVTDSGFTRTEKKETLTFKNNTSYTGVKPTILSKSEFNL